MSGMSVQSERTCTYAFPMHRFLMNNKRELSLGDLSELLTDNDITGFDPVLEAFKAYDTEGDGFIPEAKLREIFATFGLGEISSTELEILTRVSAIYMMSICS
jgi:Ca2+-binding EF-hand superfamily protein